uniref:D-alanyl-D-alanine dipeptidase n=1 Tax=Ditylenchus dipsaci TaxID=166011 RepID=A0A915DRQ8_9BILA
MLTLQAAEQLAEVQAEVEKDGFSLLIYDAYRPPKTHQKLLEYAKKLEIEIEYIERKATNCEGNTVSLTLIHRSQLLKPVVCTKRIMKIERDIDYMEDSSVDMGCSFDTFDECSTHGSKWIHDEPKKNRAYLKEVMENAGFTSSPTFWWSYTFDKIPMAKKYDFDVRKSTKNIISVSNFVNDIQEKLVYNSKQNFFEQRLKGFYGLNAPAMLSRQAVEMLANVQQEVAEAGYSLLIYDAYRPQSTYANMKLSCFSSSPQNTAVLKNYIQHKSIYSDGNTVSLTLISKNQRFRDIKRVKRKIKYEKQIEYMDDGSVDMGCTLILLMNARHMIIGVLPMDNKK